MNRAPQNLSPEDTPRLSPAGDAAVLITFADTLCPRAHAAVLALDEALRWDPFEGFVEATPSFSALLVRFDLRFVGYAEAARAVSDLLEAMEDSHAPAPVGRCWRFPVVYGGEAGPDLGDVASRAGLSEAAAAQQHYDAEHLVYMLGFLPGAPYLGGLPKVLDGPRLATPRLKVPAGSVAIAGGLSVIYPVESPGGWRILGRTPVRLFDPMSDPPALLAPGDRVRFEPISEEEAAVLERRAASGEWRPSFTQEAPA